MCHLCAATPVEVSLWHEKSGESSAVDDARGGLRVYNGHTPETKKREYLNEIIHSGCATTSPARSAPADCEQVPPRVSSRRPTLRLAVASWIKARGQTVRRSRSGAVPVAAQEAKKTSSTWSHDALAGGSTGATTNIGDIGNHTPPARHQMRIPHGGKFAMLLI